VSALLGHILARFTLTGSTDASFEDTNPFQHTPDNNVHKSKTKVTIKTTTLSYVFFFVFFFTPPPSQSTFDTLSQSQYPLWSDVYAHGLYHIKVLHHL
jgi:hypothetical protein